MDPDDSGAGKFPVDGLDVWPIIIGESSTTPHEEIVFGYNYTDKGAIISGIYKLIVGSQVDFCDHLMWSPLDYPCSEGPKGGDCDPYCLFDIVHDPGEKESLVDKEPELLHKMLDKYNTYGQEPRSMQDQVTTTSSPCLLTTTPANTWLTMEATVAHGITL